MFNLEIKKDKRNKGGYFHKVPFGLNINQTKSIAIKDMEFEKQGIKLNAYIHYESLILNSSKILEEAEMNGLIQMFN